ncbi:MAG TPA: hypothetical protein VLC09_20265, partial [Polyangiaceae bacterium]|nr:hypothetical protein [Polyangiaceae bacterium]
GSPSTGGESASGGAVATGGKASSGGSDSGLGGTDAGTGGADSGTGGSEPATGGSDAGTGGETSTGGTDAGTGGTDSGTGGGSSGGSSTVLCLTVDEHQSLELTCPEGQVIDAITFASYGMPEGSCSEDDLSIGWCDAQTSLGLVEDACLGLASCSMAAENEVFDDPCVGTFKHLSVQVVCVGP